MQDIRLIGLDLDGTVFDDAKHISPRNLAAIEAAVQAGIIVLPATGRTATGVPQAFTGIPGVHYALTSNGASVVDMRTGEHIVDQPFSLEDSLRVYDALKPFGGVFSLFVGGKSYATKADNDLIDVLVPENLRDYFRKTRIEVLDLRTVLQEKVGQVEKFSVMYPKVELRDEAWRAVLAACPDVEATTSLGSNIELNAPGVTKGSGLLALAEKLGVEVEFQEAAWDSLLIGIDTGRFDTVINSVSITDERAEKYDFSDPYYYEARRVVVRADDDSINAPEDLNGKKIATNTTNAFIPWYEENGAEVVGIDTSAEAIDLVLSGRADFLGISVPVLNAYLDEHPDAADKLKAAFVIPNSEDVIAIPVRKGEPEFLDAINAALAELREEGTLKEISEKYLGGDYTNSAYSN